MGPGIGCNFTKGPILQQSKLFTMRQIIILLAFSVCITSCVQTNTIQKGPEPRGTELQNKEGYLWLGAAATANIPVVPYNKKTGDQYNGDYQLSGKLIKVDFEEPPCAYAFIKIITDDGKKMDLYIDEDLDNFRAGAKKLFRWSGDKIFTKIDKSEKIPAEAIELSLLNKHYLFLCFKQQLNCGDDPNAPKIPFCKKIITSTGSATSNPPSDNTAVPGNYPQASERLLTNSDIAGLSKWQLKIMRNEIYARHGYIFKTDDMRSYFNQQSWYSPQYEDISTFLSKIEKANIEFIKKHE